MRVTPLKETVWFSFPSGACNRPDHPLGVIAMAFKVLSAIGDQAFFKHTTTTVVLFRSPYLLRYTSNRKRIRLLSEHE